MTTPMSGSTLFNSEPLFSAQPVSFRGRALSCLDQPLRGEGTAPAPAGPTHSSHVQGHAHPYLADGSQLPLGEVLSMCTQLECIIEKADLKQKQNIETYHEEEMITILFHQVYDVCNTMGPRKQFPDLMIEHDLCRMYPLITERVFGDDAASLPTDAQVKQPLLKDYFQNITMVGQLIAMSDQLQTDVALTNHKYMAHQIALLYQCLNQTRCMGKFKSRVEGKFEEIKRVTEGASKPVLPDEVLSWLTEVTTEIINEAAAFPHLLMKKVQPTLSLYVKARQKQL
eukprot:GFYU01010127.1.p1 GENE.GFYU01010127.1~~GFYU01010127.1.p1  ORF type:complete len:284 (-),score=12.84 GFYU01010127.1:167-1018(-)